MNKIIWVASYPKSGNTWMRYLLSNYFFNKDKKFNSNIISNIKKFHLDSQLFSSDLNKENFKKNPFNVAKYWLESQKNIKILNGNIAFLKTHNALINIKKNNFTNHDLSLAIIYIVRDPRDIVISYSKYKNLNIDETINQLISKNVVFVQNNRDLSDVEIIGSWAFNYKSWKNGIPKIPRIIIRYEDLVDNCIKSFTDVIEFLSKIMNFKINHDQIKLSVELSNFNKLKENEEINKFKENQGTELFFRTGKYNNWKTDLNKNQIIKLESKLYSEMKELKYL